MRYVVTLFWGIILGQLTGFLAAALLRNSYDPKMSLIFSVLFCLILFVIPPILDHFDAETK